MSPARAHEVFPAWLIEPSSFDIQRYSSYSAQAGHFYKTCKSRPQAPHFPPCRCIILLPRPPFQPLSSSLLCSFSSLLSKATSIAKAKMPPNSVVEWMIGQNIPPPKKQARRDVLTVALSTDDDADTDTVAVTYPRTVRSLRTTEKNVSFKIPRKSAMKTRPSFCVASSGTVSLPSALISALWYLPKMEMTESYWSC